MIGQLETYVVLDGDENTGTVTKWESDRTTGNESDRTTGNVCSVGW